MSNLSVSGSAELSNNYCDYCSEGNFSSWDGVDFEAKLIANEVNRYINCLRKELQFSDGFMGNTIKRTLAATVSSEAVKGDLTIMVVKKLAFSLCVSLPVTLFIWDIHKTMEYDCSEFSSTFEAMMILSKKITYMTGFCVLQKSHQVINSFTLAGAVVDR